MTPERTFLDIRSERAFNLVVVGIVMLGFLTLVGVGAYGVSVMRDNTVFTRWVAHTYEVEGGDFRLPDQ